jgi:hypothetical protein
MRWELLEDLHTAVQVPQGAFEVVTRNEVLCEISPASFPASHKGTLYLVATRLFLPWLTSPSTPVADDGQPYQMDIHANVLKAYIGDSQMEGVGSEPLSIIDAVLAWGMASYGAGILIASYPLDDVEFHNYLQRLTLLYPNTWSPDLKYQVYRLAAVVLHAHPSEQVRLNFIRDTLQFCPYARIRDSAFGWFKEEIAKATNGLALSQSTDGNRLQSESLTNGDTKSLFASPDTLRSLCQFLFLSDLVSRVQDDEEFWAELPHILSVLNILFHLTKSPECARLNLPQIIDELAIQDKLVAPLRKRLNDFQRKQVRRNSLMESPGREFIMLGDALNRVDGTW